MGKIEKFFKYMKERGVLWTFLYVIRFVGSRIVRGIDMYIIRIEKRKFLTGDSTVSAMYHTVEDNKRWNRYDWSTNGGEEWTQDVKKYKDLDPEKWKSSIINEMMLLIFSILGSELFLFFDMGLLSRMFFSYQCNTMILYGIGIDLG